MKVNDDQVFAEFHRRRTEEGIPLNAFLIEKYLHETRETFFRKYKAWERRTGTDPVELSPQKYMDYLTGKFGKPPVIAHPIAGSSALSSAVTQFVIAYPELRGAAINLSGISDQAMRNCKRNILPGSPLKC